VTKASPAACTEWAMANGVTRGGPTNSSRRRCVTVALCRDSGGFCRRRGCEVRGSGGSGAESSGDLADADTEFIGFEYPKGPPDQPDMSLKRVLVCRTVWLMDTAVNNPPVTSRSAAATATAWELVHHGAGVRILRDLCRARQS
jgi:hypothetical protein